MLWADVVWLQSLLFYAVACLLHCWRVLPLIWPISESFDSLHFYHARVMFVNYVHTDLILHPAGSICFGTVEKNTVNVVLIYLLCSCMYAHGIVADSHLFPTGSICFGTVEKNTANIVLIYLLCYCVCARARSILCWYTSFVIVCVHMASWPILILLPVGSISFGTVESYTFAIVLIYLLLCACRISIQIYIYC
jgi:hypothetical protein